MSNALSLFDEAQEQTDIQAAGGMQNRKKAAKDDTRSDGLHKEIAADNISQRADNTPLRSTLHGHFVILNPVWPERVINPAHQSVDEPMWDSVLLETVGEPVCRAKQIGCRRNAEPDWGLARDAGPVFLCRTASWL